MNGIQGLMQAPGQGQPPQAPGQAAPPGQGMPPMPGMQPGRGGTPTGISSDRIPDLAKLNEQMLVQLFNLSMMGQIPNPSPISVLAAISEKQKQKQAIASVQGAMAQGQNAQNQQSGTIAQQIMAPLMQRNAAHGGAMHGYNRGGIVAFQNGGMSSAERAELLMLGVSEADIDGAIQQGLTYNDIRGAVGRGGKFQLARAQPVAEQVQSLPPVVDFAEYDIDQLPEPKIEPAPQSQPAPQQVAQPEPKPEPVVQSRGLAPQQVALTAEGITSAPEANVAIEPSGIAQVQRTPPARTELPAALKEAYERRIANAALSPEQLKLQQEKQAEEMRVRKGILEAAQKRAATAEKRATEDYETEQAGIPQMFGPEFFYQIAGGISTKRGEELGSIGKSVAGFMEARRKAQTAARKDYRLAQDAADRMRAASETIQLATAERDSAIAKGNVDQARAAQDKIDQAGLDFEKAKYDRDQAAAKAVLDERRVKAEEERAEAAGRSAAAAEKRAEDYANRPEPTSDLNRAYTVELDAMLEAGEPNTPATRRKAMESAIDKLGRGAPGVRARTGQLTAANKEFNERVLTDASLRGLKGEERVNALNKLREEIENKYGVAPDAADPVAKPAPAAPVTPPAAAKPAAAPIALPAKQSELKDGVVYTTVRGPARWDAAKKQFFPVD